MEKALTKAAELPGGTITRETRESALDAPVFEPARTVSEAHDHPGRLPPGQGGSGDPPPPLHPVLKLQRSIGNQAVGRLLDSPLVQRRCQECGEEQEDIQRKPRNGNGAGMDLVHPMLGEVLALSRRHPVQAKEALGRIDPDATREVIPKSSRGEPLDDRTRSFMESRLGRDLSRVRVHTDAPAAEAAESLNATAFTTSQEIYFAPGQYAPESRSGQHLLAHELAHTVQQSNGQGPSKVARQIAGVAVGRPDDPLEREADAVADRALAAAPKVAPPERPPAEAATAERARPLAAGASTPPTPPSPPVGAPAIQREGDTESGWIQKTATEIIAEIAPELAALIREGSFHYIKRHLEKLIKDWLPSFIGNFDLSGTVEGIKSWFAQTFNSIKGAFTGDAKSCKAFADMIAKVREVAERFLNSPELQRLRAGFQAIDAAFSRFTKLILAPQFEALKDVLGSAWSGIQRISDSISGWIRKVREKAAKAWDWVAAKLGLGGGDETGVFAWLKKQAAAVWDEIKKTFAPAVEPLKKVAQVTEVLSPMGQISLIVEQGPKVVSAVSWLWEHRDDPDIAKHAREMKDTFLPQLVNSVQSFHSVMESGFSWLAGTAGSLSDSLLDLLGGLFKLPLLEMAHSAFKTIQGKVKDFVSWCQEKFNQAVAWIKELSQKVSDYVAPWKEVLSSVVMALLNPPMIPIILAGWAWRKLDRCIKKPLIEFLLAIVVKTLEAAPDLIIFGPLWPLLKAGVLGFLKEIAKATYDVQEKVSDKFAKIISGASPDFLWGFVKGFLEGIWDGIADPFRAIWAVLEGLNWVMSFFRNLAADAMGIPRSHAALPPAAPLGSGEKSAAATTTAVPSAPESPTAAPPAAAAGASAAPMAAAALAAAGPAPSAGLVAAPALSATAATMAPAAAASAAPGAAVAPEGDVVALHHGGSGLDAKDQKELGAQVMDFANDVGPDVKIVTTDFWEGAKEYFSAGGGMTFDSLMQKLGAAWKSILRAMQQKGGELAKEFIKWFMGDSAEADAGSKLGWLAGTIVFQLLLDFITAGGWVAAGPIVMAIARFINWPMEVMGQAFRLLGKFGRYLIDGAKGLASVIKDAAKGVLKVVGEAVGRIGEKLWAFVERILGRFGKLLGREGSELGERGAERLLGKEGQRLAEKEGGAFAEHKGEGLAQKTLDEAEERALREAEEHVVARHPAAAGHEIKVTANGRIIRCSECAFYSVDDLIEHYEEIAPDILKQAEHHLDRIKALERTDPTQAAKELAALDREMALWSSGEIPTRMTPARAQSAHVGEEVTEAGGRRFGEKTFIDRAHHDIGVAHGRKRATESLTPVTWHNPRAERGGYGQGFDDIMRDAKEHLVVVEYKGGESTLRPGQMSREWVELKIQEIASANPQLARELQEALDAGRLTGRVYRTPIDANGIPLETMMDPPIRYEASVLAR